MRSRTNIWSNIDWVTILLYLLLCTLGWVNIYSAVYNEEHTSIFDISQRYGKQIIWIGAACLVAVTIILIDSKFFISFAFPFYGLTLFLLLFVLLFGTEVNGAKSWFQIGEFAFQPSELTKTTTALALASFLSSYDYKPSISSLAIIALIIGTPILFILLQNDTGSALVFFVFILVLYREGLPGIFLFLGFVAAITFIISLLFSPIITILSISCCCVLSFGFISSNWKDTFKMLLMCVIIFALTWLADAILNLQLSDGFMASCSFAFFFLVCIVYAFIHKAKKNIRWLLLIYFGLVGMSFSVDYVFESVLEPHQRVRIEELLGMSSDPLGAGYNVNQSKIAIGSGGLSGKGFLQGTQTKFNFVPEQSTDFIFCTVGEEWGFLGTSIVIILFIALLLRLIFLAERQRSSFSRIYGYSVACIIFFHMAINIAMTIGLAPVIGIPLPFFSYGGSSLWSFTIMLFIFVRLDASRSEKLSN
ncbi:MAG: rod shape-determining protein RodA [Mangrovibacterium sp.]